MGEVPSYPLRHRAGRVVGIKKIAAGEIRLVGLMACLHHGRRNPVLYFRD